MNEYFAKKKGISLLCFRKWTIVFKKSVTFCNVSLLRWWTLPSKLFGYCHFRPLWSILLARIYFEFWITKMFTKIKQEIWFFSPKKRILHPPNCVLFLNELAIFLFEMSDVKTMLPFFVPFIVWYVCKTSCFVVYLHIVLFFFNKSIYSEHACFSLMENKDHSL